MLCGIVQEMNPRCVPAAHSALSLSPHALVLGALGDSDVPGPSLSVQPVEGHVDMTHKLSQTPCCPISVQFCPSESQILYSLFTSISLE